MPFGAALSICSEGNFEASHFLFSTEFHKYNRPNSTLLEKGKKISLAATAETVEAILHD